MSYILCIETTTTNCSVALLRDDVVCFLQEDNSATYSHAEKLHCFIQEIVSGAEIGFSDIDAIAVSKGPGSYTGLRIGVSAAKGLCYALDIPLISVPTLEVLALQIQSNYGYIVPMIDARRMEVYSAVFNNRKQIRSTEAEILEANSFSEYLDKDKVFFIGNGVSKFKTICNHKNAVFIENKLPSANEMALLVYNKYRKKQFENIGSFDPYYLKEFVAG